MKKKILTTLLASFLLIGLLPISVSATWKQNADNSWSWTESGHKAYYGWEKINGSWYYFKNGKMQTGWLNNGYYYYLGQDGAMKTGWINDGGKQYYLKNDGVLVTDSIIDGYYVDSNGVMQPKENEKVILDNEYVKITSLGVNDTGYSKQIKVKVENKSNQQLIVQTDDVSVNGIMAYAMFSPNITAGNSAIAEIEFNDSSIVNGFNNIEGKFAIITKDYETIEKDDFSIKL